MNHTLYTKNLHNKTLGSILFVTFFFSCSPTVYILDHKPKLGGNIFKGSVNKTQKKITKSKNDIHLLREGVEQLTTYAYGFLIEESDRVIIYNYSKAKELESEAYNYFTEAVGYGDSALSLIYDDYIDWVSNDNNDIVITPKSSDLNLFYWTAAAYGGAISSSGGNPSWIIKLPRVGKLLNTIVTIDSSWNKGAALVALISYTMNNPRISADEAAKISKKLLIS